MSTQVDTFRGGEELKRKWVEALRSGNFRQTTDSLSARHDNRDVDPEAEEYTGYCCLGVLKVLAEGLAPGTLVEGAYVHADSEGDPMDGELLTAKTQKRLATLNDEGKSFNYIAGYIERYL